MAVDWSILASRDQALDPITAAHLGDADRRAQQQADLQQQQFDAKQAAAAQAQAGYTAASAAYGKGDYQGAQAALIGTGDSAMVGAGNTSATGEQTRQIDAQKFVGGVAKALMDSTDESHLAERTAYIEHNRPVWQHLGISDAEIDQIAANPTNANLTPLTASGYDAKDQDAAAVAQQNADATTSNAASTAQNAQTAAAAEQRQEQTPIGIDPTNNVYLPGGGGAAPGATGAPAQGRTTGGWTPRQRNGGDNPDAVVDNKIAGAAKFLCLDPNGDLRGVSPIRIAQAMTLSEGGPGSLADRNNNPANIRDGAFARSQPGYLGAGAGGYARFADKNSGLAAAGKLVAGKLANGQTTVRTMIEGLPVGGAFQGGAQNSGPRMIAAGTPKVDPNAVDPSDPAIQLAARQYAATGEMPPLGNGNAPMRRAILNQAAQISAANHWTPGQIQANKAQLKASQSALAADNKMYDTIQTSEQTAIANGERYINLSQQAPGNTSSATYNSLRNALGGEFSDTRVTDMNGAYQTFIGEYNRVVNSTPSGSGTLSDSSRHEAEAAFSNATSPSAKRATFEVLKADMAARRQAQQAIIDRRTALINNIGNPHPQTAQAPAPAGRAAPPVGFRAQRNGRTFTWTGSTWSAS